jgi:hypothetical protein
MTSAPTDLGRMQDGVSEVSEWAKSDHVSFVANQSFAEWAFLDRKFELFRPATESCR